MVCVKGHSKENCPITAANSPPPTGFPKTNALVMWKLRQERDFEEALSRVHSMKARQIYDKAKLLAFVFWIYFNRTVILGNVGISKGFYRLKSCQNNPYLLLLLILLFSNVLNIHCKYFNTALCFNLLVSHTVCIKYMVRISISPSVQRVDKKSEDDFCLCLVLIKIFKCWTLFVS